MPGSLGRAGDWSFESLVAWLDALPEVEFWVRNLLRDYETTDHGPRDGAGNRYACKPRRTGSTPTSSAG